ncbi:hypothetical protein JTB14_004622 [Gonioctena quinquepunctata]|nr:hypothetical protein JTB14_004622 [Gonioctena quinquepunctata]
MKEGELKENQHSTSHVPEIGQDVDSTSSNTKTHEQQFNVLEDDVLLSDSDDSVAVEDYNPLNDDDYDTEDNVVEEPHVLLENERLNKRKVSRRFVTEQIRKKRIWHVSEWVVNK